MPTTTQAPVKALAHCVDSFCKGNEQAPVDGLLEETRFSFVELGGDAPGFERSQTAVRFANEADISCPHCEGVRDITEQKRPRYEARVGNPEFLKELIQKDMIKAPGDGSAESSADVAALKAQVELLTQMIAGNQKPAPKPKAE